MDKKERFKVTYSARIYHAAVTIIVDKETGVNYLLAESGYSSGLTPLLDADGKPIVTKTDETN